MSASLHLLENSDATAVSSLWSVHGEVRGVRALHRALRRSSSADVSSQAANGSSQREVSASGAEKYGAEGSVTRPRTVASDVEVDGHQVRKYMAYEHLSGDILEDHLDWLGIWMGCAEINAHIHPGTQLFANLAL